MVTVYLKKDGSPLKVHAVDALELCRSGEYTDTAPAKAKEKPKREPKSASKSK